MVRRTKEDAAATRESILDAAGLLFEQQGVSGTTLQHIASAAGVTRGAIYWHFHDKSALFDALMERAKLPLESAMLILDAKDTDDPLGDLRECLMCVFRLTARDEGTRRVFAIATHKLELVGEMSAISERILDSHARFMERAESRIRIAVKRGLARPGVPPKAVAMGLWSAMDGLLRIWLLQPGAFNLEKMGSQVMAAQLECLRPA
jgi:TetR/AcrR family acrAB operon transcriptional repressor